jgi:hypothetical protein
MKDYKTENLFLESKIKKLQEKVDQQNELINDYKNNYFINMFNSLSAICEEQYKLLNPVPIFLKASYKGKPETYEVFIDNVICAFSDGRIKTIVLKKPIVGIGSNARKTLILSCNYPWSELISSFNRVNINLFQANKSTLVNLRHYVTENNYILYTKELPEGYHAYKKIKLENEKLAHFVNRKENYDRIFSLHKYLLRYNIQNGLPI